MTLIKAYHSCKEEAYNAILKTGAIVTPAVKRGPKNPPPGWDPNTSKFWNFSFFRPIQPLLYGQWGDNGFVFDSELLIQEFNGCLCYDSFIVYNSDQEEIDEIYSNLIEKYEEWGIRWPKVGPLYGDDALDVLRQLQPALDSFNYTSIKERSDSEAWLMNLVELKCSVEVPINRAYSHYKQIPVHTWWQGERWSDIDPNAECIHHSQWESKGYEIRLNQ